MHNPDPSARNCEGFHSPAICAALRTRDERLEAFKIFAGKLAHDFRNTLVPQLGYVTLIKEEAAKDSPILSFVTKLENATRKLEIQLDAILLAVRPERRFSPKNCDFSALIKRAVGSWASGLPKDASIKIDLALDACDLVVDKNQWEIALGQLLKNAQFALVGGGKLEIFLRRRMLTPDQSAALSLETPDVFEFVAKDDGFGMSEAILSRACEPFFTTRPKGQAAGLGLTIVHSISRLHGGQFVIESQEDAGTAVTIWLPAKRSGSADQRFAFGQTPSVTGTGEKDRKAVFIGMDPILSEVAKSQLRRAPFEILSAPDSVEGLKLIQRHGAAVSVIILGGSLAEREALKECRNFRRAKSDVPLVLLLGGEDETTPEDFDELGPPRPVVLRKPFALRTLTEAVFGLAG